MTIGLVVLREEEKITLSTLIFFLFFFISRRTLLAQRLSLFFLVDSLAKFSFTLELNRACIHKGNEIKQDGDDEYILVGMTCF